MAAAAAICYLNVGGGNRLGALISNGANTIRVPARSGREHVHTLLRTIATTPKAPVGVRGDLAATIDALRRPERRRGMAVIISDFLGPINWMRPLRAIAARHEVLAIEVLDPRDVELPDIGDVVLQDAESGAVREFTIDSPTADRFRPGRGRAPRRRSPHDSRLRCPGHDASHRPGLDWRHRAFRFQPPARGYGGAPVTGLQPTTGLL